MGRARVPLGDPGLVGATPIQNVGAYGQDVSQTVTGPRAWIARAGAWSPWRPRTAASAIATACFRSADPERFVVLAVTYRLRPGGVPAVRYPD